ncbi:DMT family transporter [Crenobacter intestini]|uniref:DMT family transporter n=1 Tax=Crenobacter intestini TaxID=2563443 RepID=A0A4T0UU37_9NEIS|nr:DMT family transporter [Crenobacter intestini]TIC82085.1 DMT family transporter [Crenobacter intestini]
MSTLTAFAPHPAQRRALVQLTLGVCCLAASPLLVRLSHVGPIASAFYRLLLAQPVLLLLMYGRLAGVPVRTPEAGRHHRVWAWVAGACLGLNLALWNQSLTMISVANATLIDNLAPVFIALFAWFAFGERPGARLSAGMLLAVGGASLLALGESAGAGSGAVFEGHLIALAGAVFYAAYFLALKPAMAGGRFETVMLESSLAATLTLAPLMLISGEHWWPQGWMAWGILLMMALCVHCAGQGLVGKGFAALPASSASLLLLLQPVISAALAWLMFGEALGALQLAGASAVLAGLYWAGGGGHDQPRG